MTSKLHLFYCRCVSNYRHHVSELMVPGFGRLMQLHRSEADRCVTTYRLLDSSVMKVREDFSTYRQLSYECVCCEVIVVRICSISHKFYGFSVYRNPDLKDKIFNNLSTAECSSCVVTWVF